MWKFVASSTLEMLLTFTVDAAFRPRRHPQPRNQAATKNLCTQETEEEDDVIMVDVGEEQRKKRDPFSGRYE